MGRSSRIEWTDHTFNPWIGCQKVGPGCDHCYAEAWDGRFGGGHWGPHAERRKTGRKNWLQPLRWNAEAARAGRIDRVFAASLADVFDNAVPRAWRTELWDLVRATPALDWIVVTKRIGNAAGMLPDDWGDGWDNVILLATVCDQAEADRDVPKLLATPATRRGLSIEPMLDGIDLAWSLGGPIGIAAGFLERGSFAPGLETLRPLEWIICGGESGALARPMDGHGARELRDQCVEAAVAFHFKQHGEWIDVRDLRDLPGGGGPGFGAYDDCPFDVTTETVRVGRKVAGRLLDGRTWDGYPARRAA